MILARIFKPAARAQLISVGSTLLIQILQLPAFLQFVGPNIYGSYLTLIAAPSVLTLSDFGLLEASSTHMLKAVSRGRPDVAGEIARGTRLFLSLVFLLIAAIAIPAVLLFLTGVGYIDRATAAWIVLLYIAYALAIVGTSMVEGILRAANRFVLGWNFITGLRFVDFGASILVLALSRGNLVIAVAAMLTSRLVGLGLFWMLCLRIAPWARGVPRFRDLRQLRGLVRPMIGSLIRPLSNIAMLQGSVLIVGLTFAPPLVVLYSAARTMSNAVRQFSMVFYNAELPGLTAAIGNSDRTQAFRQYREIVLLGGATTLLGATALALLGPPVLRLWSSNQLGPSEVLLLGFAVVVVLDASWTLIGSWLDADNRHFWMSITYGLTTLGYLVAAIFAARSVEALPWLQTVFLGLLTLVTILLVRADMRRFDHGN